MEKENYTEVIQQTLQGIEFPYREPEGVDFDDAFYYANKSKLAEIRKALSEALQDLESVEKLVEANKPAGA